MSEDSVASLRLFRVLLPLLGVMLRLILFFLCGFALIGMCSADSHSRRLGHHHYCYNHRGHKVCRVGDAAGWTIRTRTNFTMWASSKSFTVGDIIIFDYNKRYHNVLQLDSDAYKRCKTFFPLATYTTGHDPFMFHRKGTYYFIDSHYCKAGQKMSISVSDHHQPQSTSSVVPRLGGIRRVVALGSITLMALI